eukprot:gnl/TRDRNA2_/TRDRNA2_112310_c0_seq1.p1 gnl/TRDRNA2_/TRDRNA2_112310_c0~~gnl/TRDRNA2_/TRDRNA2_112310_c0_seq1.p1  ORF type:complete len:101 (-),score=36.48 gnl/TRDRNA2_/TRDRNA2_112310_c0_seq1:74-376(-)
MQCGGAQETEVTDEVRGIVKEMMKEISEAAQKKGRVGEPIEHLEVLEMMEQVVAGMNYFVKAKVNKSEELIHVRIWDQFGTKEVSDVKIGDEAAAKIEYF